ncbi:MAG: protein-disulfide reductase DsbD family protein [Bacteroidia bacterium]|nr:protein-disulfide reductase DsbD family protein [Bacteroidia bacterium]
MKKHIFIITSLFLAISLSSFSQVIKPVKWSFSSRRISSSEAELIFRADILDKWHVYSPYTPDGGPLPMVFNFEKSTEYSLSGKVSESKKPQVEYDDVFNVNTLFFTKQVTFSQKVKLAGDSGQTIKGSIEYQACIEGKCIPDATDFIIKVDKFSNQDKSQVVPAPVIGQGDTLAGQTKLTADTSEKTVASPAAGNNGKPEEGKSMWALFWLAFGGGLLAILTPCIFPMIPMTVSFFLGSGGKKHKTYIQAGVFGISIILIYTLLGLIVSLAHAGADFGTVLSTHWIPNLIFFVLFLIFALSFFGLFEIILPGNIGNKTDSLAEKGGAIGAFFMALTLVIVSFACTGPIIGAILVAAAHGVSIQPIIGMLGYSIAFALPFTLFALFPSAMKKMPRSGGWLNVIKVVMAFIMLALSFKFISNIDQTYHLNMMSREAFIAIWVAIFTLTGFYLLGMFQLPHDSKTERIGVYRMLFAVASIAFAVYLFTGFTGNSLKSLSMFLPPPDEKEMTVVSSSEQGEYPGICGKAKYSEYLHLSNGLKGYFDYKEGLACAQQQNKPVLLYFKGHACTNCKVMDAKVVSDPAILDIIRNKYVVIALYCDERNELPQNEWVTSTFDKKVKKTIGQVNIDYQITRFQTNTQPFYATLDKNGNLTGQPVGYTDDIPTFTKFLRDGVTSSQK